MKRRRISLAAFGLALCLPGSGLNAQEKKIEATENRIIIRAVKGVDADVEVGVEVREEKPAGSVLKANAFVFRHDVRDDGKAAAEIYEILKKFGLKDDQLNDAMGQIKKSLAGNGKEAKVLFVPKAGGAAGGEAGGEAGGGAGGAAGDAAAGEADANLRRAKAVIVGPNGERKEIDLTIQVENSAVPKDAGGKPLTIRGYPLDKTIFEKLQSELHSSGVDPEHIKRLRIAVEQAGKEAGGVKVERVIVGENGKVVVGGLPGQGDAQGRVMIAVAASGGQFIVGLNCVPASDVLRSQLKLGDAGLVVESVFDDSPAAKAGVKLLDVLTKADDAKLGSLKDLTDAIQHAGKAKQPVVLTLIRQGEEQKISVTPSERKMVDLNDSGNLLQHFLVNPESGETRIQLSVGGLLSPTRSPMGTWIKRQESGGGGEDAEGLKKKVQHLERQVIELQELFKKSQNETDAKAKSTKAEPNPR